VSIIGASVCAAGVFFAEEGGVRLGNCFFDAGCSLAALSLFFLAMLQILSRANQL
jgi:hypothetical protein